MAAMKVWYDREGDYLEVLFEDAPATLEELDEDVFERRTPDGRIVGFAIFNFTKREQHEVVLPLSVTSAPVPS